MGFTGQAIEEPKSPAAHRAWQLLSIFQPHGSNPFASPGIAPSTYSATMQKNVRLLFAGFHDHVADIVDDLESGKALAENGEQSYQYYRSLPCIKSFPSAKDVNGYD